MRAAAFFDRDGTINVNFGHVYKPKDLVFVPYIPEIIADYNRKGVPVIVVTNQAGIAKGIYSEQDMHRFNQYMNERLMKEYGAHVDAIYFCPHHPDVTGICDCRKPKAGMLFRAAAELDIDLATSVMYGDKDSDRKAAEAAGLAKFILVSDPRNVL